MWIGIGFKQITFNWFKFHLCDRANSSCCSAKPSYGITLTKLQIEGQVQLGCAVCVRWTNTTKLTNQSLRVEGWCTVPQQCVTTQLAWIWRTYYTRLRPLFELTVKWWISCHFFLVYWKFFHPIKYQTFWDWQRWFDNTNSWGLELSMHIFCAQT